LNRREGLERTGVAGTNPTAGRPGGGIVRWGSDDGSFEVFAQFGTGKDIQQVGSVRATDPELAWHAAKETYTRRERCSLLWVVARDAILMSDAGDTEVLQTGRRLEHRHPTFPGAHRRARIEAAQGDGDQIDSTTGVAR
jgi:phenylacetate-CoA oxygenase PaaH subunit